MPNNSDNPTQTLEEVYNIAGPSLSKILDAYCPKDKDLLVRWFYDSNNKGLGKSPADFCKEEGSYKLECILMDLMYGNFGL